MLEYPQNEFVICNKKAVVDGDVLNLSLKQLNRRNLSVSAALF